MNNTTIINIFNSNNSNVDYIKTQNCQTMTTRPNRILKLESMINKSIVANHAFAPVVTFGKINFFVYVNSVVISIYNI